VAECEQYGFYHLPAYHALAERRGEGAARLFVHRAGGRVIALPLLLRPVKRISGLEDLAHQDARSVYGYGGPISSKVEDRPELVQGFQSELRDVLFGPGVVAGFSRLHPLIRQSQLAVGLGECQVPENICFLRNALISPQNSRCARLG
jgi:hypothetical protein